MIFFFVHGRMLHFLLLISFTEVRNRISGWEINDSAASNCFCSFFFFFEEVGEVGFHNDFV